MKPKILFADDEVFFAQPYLDELEKKFDVTVRENAADAVESLLINDGFIAAVIDVMMPPPEGKEGATGDGMDTGLWLLKECREVIIARKMPIIVLTNRTAKYVAEYIKTLGIPSKQILIQAKIETPRFILPHRLEKLIQDQTAESS